MIITVTPNPAIDRTIIVPHLRLGQLHRARAVWDESGGKGMIVARVAGALGAGALCLGFVAGWLGGYLRALLDAEGMRHHLTPCTGETRINITLVDEASGVVTKVNEPGPKPSPAEVEALLAAVEERLRPGDWLAICGSFPPGVAAETCAELVRRGRRAGARVALDTSGRPLAAGAAAGPTLLKPNLAELDELAGRRHRTLGEVVVTARQQLEQGCDLVVVTLGARGAVAVAADGWAHLAPPRQHPAQAVGAGDALLAGLLVALERGESWREALSLGVAAGTAMAATPGSRTPDRSAIDDLHRALGAALSSEPPPLDEPVAD